MGRWQLFEKGGGRERRVAWGENQVGGESGGELRAGRNGSWKGLEGRDRSNRK
jgi:hypothetical protein